jgi:hypothetical protein
VTQGFASGRIAHAFCDRCGFRSKLSLMKKITVNEKLTNIKVCPTCWEPDHPQYRIGRVDMSDPQALRDPRPDTALEDSRELF